MFNRRKLFRQWIGVVAAVGGSALHPWKASAQYDGGKVWNEVQRRMKEGDYTNFDHYVWNGIPWFYSRATPRSAFSPYTDVIVYMEGYATINLNNATEVFNKLRSRSMEFSSPRYIDSRYPALGSEGNKSVAHGYWIAAMMIMLSNFTPPTERTMEKIMAKPATILPRYAPIVQWPGPITQLIRSFPDPYPNQVPGANEVFNAQQLQTLQKLTGLP